MTSTEQDKWCRGLAGKAVGKFNLVDFIGAGRIGYVYKAQLRDLPSPIYRAVKLTFDLKTGWETELKKVMSLELVPGVVHFHELGTEQITHDGKTRLCQYTVWDYISPGENLHQYLARTNIVPASFLLAVVERILHVLHACETAGIVRHGDLHAGNILIGDESRTTLDDSLQPRAPIYVSDFGYGATAGAKAPKDDYQGLAHIINAMIPRVDYSTATATHRQILQAMQRDFGKLLNEKSGTERSNPLELLGVIHEIKRVAQSGAQPAGKQQLVASAQSSPSHEVNCWPIPG